jgi:hypothetical protein
MRGLWQHRAHHGRRQLHHHRFSGRQRQLQRRNARPATFSIAKAATTTTVTCEAGPFTYDGSAQTPCSASVTGSGLGQALTVSYKDNVDAGTATASASYTESANYLGSSDSETFTIGKRAITVTADAQSKTYGDADPALTYKVTTGSLANANDLSGSLTRVAGQDVGTYAIQQGTLAGSGNYTLTFVGANLTIEKRAITVTADAQGKTYGDADPALTYKVTTGSLANANDLSGSLTRVAGQDVGTYAIQRGTLSANSNYALTFVGANFTITKRAIEVTAANKTKVYGDADPALTYTITSGTLAAGDSLSGSLTRVAGQDVGTYAIQRGTLSANSNYSFTFVGADFTITKRAITVTADSHTKLLGAADPALTLQGHERSTGSGRYLQRRPLPRPGRDRRHLCDQAGYALIEQQLRPDVRRRHTEDHLQVRWLPPTRG